MKKYFSLLIMCSVLLFACGNSSNKNKNSNPTIGDNEVVVSNEQNSNKINWQEGDVIAVAFLGYFNDFESFTNTVAYEQYCKIYPQLKGIKGFAVNQPGDETYLIIARNPNADITVSNYDILNLDNTQILFKNEDGVTGENVSAFLIKGNVSDATPNMMITCVDNGNILSEYSPCLNLHQGHVQLPGLGGVADITVYHNTLPNMDVASFVGNSGKEFATVEIRNGRPFLMVDEENYDLWQNIKILSNYIPGNLNGIVVGVKSGEIGQDINPILCCIMADGTARIIALYDIFRYIRCLYAEAIDLDGKRLMDVVDFVTDGAGEFELENGEKGYTYRTVYAIDSKGKRREIKSSMISGYFTYYREADPTQEDDAGLNIELALLQNFAMLLQVHDMGSLYFQGTYRYVGDSESPYLFEFEGYNAAETSFVGNQEGKAKGTITINRDNTITLKLGEPYNLSWTLMRCN
jgi:hypothetical protein